MANILLIVSAQVGHVHATFRLARRLIQRGHAITYAGPARARAMIEPQGLPFREAPLLEPAEAWLAARGAARWTRRDRAAYTAWLAAEAARLVAEAAPELIVFDPFALVYYLLIWPHGVPAVVLSANPLLDRDPRVPPYTSSLVPPPSPSRCAELRVAAAWGWAWASSGARWLRFAAERARTGHSDHFFAAQLAAATRFPLARERVARPVWFDFCLRSVPELVLWPARYDLPRARPLRPGVRYVGPSTELDRAQPELDWSAVPAAARLAYCALGTVELPRLVARRRSFLRGVVRAFERMPDCALVVATGRSIDPDELGPLPRNVAAWPEVPQLAILRRADLFITHGGANSIKEAILSGVPMLVYPRRADQPGNAARVVYHRLGVRGDARADGPDAIARAARRVLGDPAYRARVAGMRDVFLDDDRRELDADAVEAHLGRRPGGP